MPLGAPHDRLNSGDQLTLVEGLRQVVVSPHAQALDLVVQIAEARENEDWCLNTCSAQTAQDFVTIDIREHEIENDNVVVVKLADL